MAYGDEEKDRIPGIDETPEEKRDREAKAAATSPQQVEAAGPIHEPTALNPEQQAALESTKPAIAPPMLPQEPAGGAIAPSITAAQPPLPTSSLGGKIAPGQPIPGGMMHRAEEAAYGGDKQAGKEAFERNMPSVTAKPGSAEYYEQKQAQLDFKQAHPWGSAESAHPGIAGKILHGLGVAGNIAGSILAPSVMMNIPGTALNQRAQQVANEEGIKAGYENQLKAAQTEKADKAGTAGKEEEWTLNNEWQTKGGNPVLVEKHSNQVIDSVTKKPVAPGEMMRKGEVVGANVPAPAEAVADYANKVRTLKLTPDEMKVYGSAPPNVTKAELEKRYQDAVGLHNMTQKDRETQLRDQERVDNKAMHETEHAEGRADKSYQGTTARLDKLADPLTAANQRMERLKATLAQHTPQADALVAPELLTVMAGGMGSGLRMNEAEISRIVGGRVMAQELKSRAERYTNGADKSFLITDAQRLQIDKLIAEVQARVGFKTNVLAASREELLKNPDDVSKHREIRERTEKLLNQDIKTTTMHGGQRYYIMENGTVFNERGAEVK